MEQREREWENSQQQLARERELRQQQAERDRQLKAETQAKLKQIEQERHKRQLEMIANNAPQYVAAGGGGSSCCGNCIHYMIKDNKCAYNKYRHPSGASDYCNDHRSR